MLQKLIQATAIIAILTGTASAQSINPFAGTNREVSPQDAARKKVLEGEYDSAVNKIPDKKASSDPWGTVRPKADQSAGKQKRP